MKAVPIYCDMCDDSINYFSKPIYIEELRVCLVCKHEYESSPDEEQDKVCQLDSILEELDNIIQKDKDSDKDDLRVDSDLI